MKTALSIAGTDPSGGAGIQADLKTMTMNGVFAMSAITALVAQNTTGVKEIVEMTPEFLGKQIDAVYEDIPPDAVKIGMVASGGLIETIAERLRFYHAKNIVVDPVMVATSGDRLISESAVATLKSCLLPLAAVITPNIPEAEILSGMISKPQPGTSAMLMDVQSCSRADMISMMPMTFSMEGGRSSGSMGNGLTTLTRMAQAAPFQARLLQIWQRGLTCLCL